MARSTVNNRFLIRDTGTCLSFNGTTSEVTVPHSSTLLDADYIGISLWLKPTDSHPAFMTPFAKPNEYMIESENSTTSFKFRAFFNIDGADQPSDLTSTQLKPRERNHLFFDYDASTHVIRGFVNGQLDVSTTLTGLGTYLLKTSGTNDLDIGWRTGFSRHYAGLMDDVIVFKATPLTTSQIQDIYYKGINRSTDLALLLRFNEGSGTTATDSSGNSNDAALSNASYSTDSFFSSRTAATRTNSLLYNGNFEVKPSVITAATTGASRWIDGTTAGSSARSGLGWAALVVTPNAEAGFDTTVFRSGTASMRLSTLNAAGAITVGSYRTNPPVASSLFELFTLVPGTTYSLNGYIRTNNVATNGAFVDVREFNATGGTVTTWSTSKLSGTDTSWRNVNLSFTADANTRFGGIFLRNNVAGNVSDAWFDDITLTPLVIGRNAA